MARHPLVRDDRRGERELTAEHRGRDDLCVRAAPGSADLMPHAEINSSSDGHNGTPVNASAAYVPVRAAWDVATAYPNITVNIRADGVAGSCVLVDDVSFARVRDAGN